MRLIFATDFHGNEFAYRALFHTALTGKLDGIVLGGDLGPSSHFAGDLIETQRVFADASLGKRLREFRDATDIPVFAIPGNDDCGALAPEWERFQEEGLWHFIPNRAIPFRDGYSVAGLPYVPVTPFRLSDFDRIDVPGWRPPRCPMNMMLTDTGQIRHEGLDAIEGRTSIAAALEDLASKSDPKQTIYVMHSPPHGTALDLMHDGQPVGSEAIKVFIERHEPPVTLHGHVHESYSRSGRIYDHIGKTLVLNPGPSLDRLRAVLVHVGEGSPTHRLLIV